MSATVSPNVAKAIDGEEVDSNGFDESRTTLIPDEDSWKLYTDFMNEVIEKEFTQKRKLVLPHDELTAVQAYLLNNSAIAGLPSPMDVLSESRDTIRNRLTQQKEAFVRQSRFTPAMYELCGRCLIYMNDLCAKRQVKAPSLPAWLKLRECGLTPRENAVSTFLYVLSMQNDNVQLGNDDLFRNISLDVAIFHDLLYFPNEKSALVRIKALIMEGDAKSAEKVLATLSAKRSSDRDDSLLYKRLRTYQPIFQHYCDTGNLLSAFRLYREMQKTPGVYLVAETYSLLIAAAARNGWFHRKNDLSIPIKKSRRIMRELKFNASSGPSLFDELCSELANNLLELDESSAALIMDGLNDGFNLPSPKYFAAGWVSDISRWFYNLIEHHPHKQTKRRLFVQRVSIDNTTACCPETGARLRLLTLSQQQKRQVHDSLLQMATFEQEKFSDKGPSRKGSKTKVLTKEGRNEISDQDAKNASYALKELSLFSDWLRYRTGDAFTAFIDGPNVAYYGHGDVRWNQVEQVFNTLEQMGENPLVIMPQKYMSPKFYLSSLGRTQELSEADLAFIKKLVNSKKMYVVPTSCLDDYYWMLSSVADQKPHSKLEHVTTDDRSGRFPGLRPLLVTNDQMRDHRLSLLEPRLFRRWTSCHIVKYHIEPCNSQGTTQRVTLFPADFFSREVQSNKAIRFGESMAWHFPISEWPEPDRLCVTILR
jgi:pentatricopeptide repeat protein